VETVSAHPARVWPVVAALPGSCCRSATSLLQDEYWQVSAQIYLRCTWGRVGKRCLLGPRPNRRHPRTARAGSVLIITAPHRPLTCGNCPVVQDLHDLRGNQPNLAHGGPGRGRRRRATLFAAVRCARGSCGRPGRTVPCPTGPRQGRALAGQGGNVPLVYPRWTWAGGAADRQVKNAP
jgi:hypothetical protein